MKYKKKKLKKNLTELVIPLHIVVSQLIIVRSFIDEYLISQNDLPLKLIFPMQSNKIQGMSDV